MKKKNEKLSSVDVFASVLGVNVDTVMNCLYTSIQNRVQCLKDEFFNSRRALRTVDSASLVFYSIEDYFTDLNMELDFEIDIESPFYNILKGYTFSLLLDMLTVIKSKGYKMFLEIEYHKQEVQYTLI